MNKNKENTFAQVETTSPMMRLHAVACEPAHRQLPAYTSSIPADDNLGKSKNTASLKNNYPYFYTYGDLEKMFSRFLLCGSFGIRQNAFSSRHEDGGSYAYSHIRDDNRTGAHRAPACTKSFYGFCYKNNAQSSMFNVQ
ncbi:MAG: hypothetical protein J5678_07615 [Bacteroidaceae bacterium]|nr:hypothetical protein [Bacteroidaceae bacterium]